MKKNLHLFILLFYSIATNAQWSSSPTTNLLVCNESNNQMGPQITSDGSGGAIVIWEDTRNSGGGFAIQGNDLYAQRVNSNGNLVWANTGVAICNAYHDPHYYELIQDGNGGAIIAWGDTRVSGNQNIYAQHIDANGIVQWTTDGVAICTATNVQKEPHLISDGAGGAIIVWTDHRNINNGNFVDVYAQRINANGAVAWANNGISIASLVSTNVGIEPTPAIISDGQGGAIITWADNRTGNFDIYAQRINGSGIIQWTLNGIPVCTAANKQELPQIATDEIGGAIISWVDDRPGDTTAVYAQKINSNGAVQWTTDGVAICNTSFQSTRKVRVLSDGIGGAFIVFTDERSEDQDIYAQLINTNGVVQWIVNGVGICTNSSLQYNCSITTDGAYGLIVTWSQGGYTDIYAQRIDNNGIVQWNTYGNPVCTRSGYDDSPTITYDNTGGAIITWTNTEPANVYAQNICHDGSLGVCAPVSLGEEENANFTIYPNPAINTLTIETEQGKGIYQLLDITGKVLLSGSLTATKFTLDISALSKGIYLLSLIDGEQQVNRKVVKE